ncbi:tetraspanin-3-like [Tiliqua scincoides]|uniref:tetraspanin-3-like n=1 Tax=Tiliqua scincoides TaxID=71010 RepID=UPI0034622BBE
MDPQDMHCQAIPEPSVPVAMPKAPSERVASRMKEAKFSSTFSPPLLCSTESWSQVFAKVALSLLGFFLWGAAVAFLFGGAFVMLTYRNYSSFFHNPVFLVLAWLAFVAAFFLFLTGVLAMCTPVKTSRHHQGTLMYLLVVLFCLEASSVVIIQLSSATVCNELRSSVDSFFHQNNRTVPNHYANVSVDMTHKQLQCCGIYNYTDWIGGMLLDRLQTQHASAPESCCKETYMHCLGDASEVEKLFKEGCLKKLEERLHFVTCYVSWCCVVVGCLEVLAVISNGMLMRELPFQDFRILDSAAFS